MKDGRSAVDTLPVPNTIAGMKRRSLLAFVGMVTVCAARGMAAPEAEPSSTAWQLDFTFADPQRLTVQLPGATEPSVYWYVLFTVTNRTGRDVEFYPSFRLVTDTLTVVDGGSDVSPTVYEQIGERHKSEYPFLAPPWKVTGPLLQGEENSRSSVAVFSKIDTEASSFTLYVGGLSGDIRRTVNPAFDASKPESTSNTRFFVLRRTLAIEYALPGDEQSVLTVAPVRRNRFWTMR